MNTNGPEWIPTVNPQNATHSSCFENTYNEQITDDEAQSTELSMDLILKMTPAQYVKRRQAIVRFLQEHARPGRGGTWGSR